MIPTSDFFYLRDCTEGIFELCPTPLEKITHRKENREAIEFITDKFLIVKSDLITSAKHYEGLRDGDYSKSFKKFGLFLILNAGFTEFLKLDLDDEMERHIKNYVIPKCVLVELLWYLEEKSIFGAITYTTPQLSVEFTELIVDYLKYDDPVVCVERVKMLAPSIYRQICRLHFGTYSTELMSTFTNTTFNNFKKCIDYIRNGSVAKKLRKSGVYQLYRFKGRRLYIFLYITHECISKFLSTEDINDGFEDFYKGTFSKDNKFFEDKPSKSFKICESKNELILECLYKCNTILLDVCNELVMNVNVDQFCSWCNFVYTDLNKNLQDLIGELSYNLHTKLSKMTNMSGHPLLDLLESIAITPVTVLEIINYTDSKTIVNNIMKKDDDSILWIHALVSKNDLCYDNLLVEQVEAFISTFTTEECQILFNKFKDYLFSLSNEEKEKDEKYLDKVSLIFKLFKTCETEVQHTLIDGVFKDNCFHEKLKIENFDSMITVYFNNLATETSKKGNYVDVLYYFLQSPISVYIKIFSVAIENSPQTEIMLKVIKLIQKYSCHSYEADKQPCVIQVAKYTLDKLLNTELKRENYINFMASLKTINVIPGFEMINLIIMPMVYEKLVKRDIVYLNLAITLLQKLNMEERMGNYRAPLLVMLSQMMDTVRWDFETFNILAPDTLNQTLKFQMSLLKSYGSIPESDVKWLKSKLGTLHPLNSFYFRLLWKVPSRNYLEVISGSRINKEMNKLHLVIWLMDVIYLCTLEEWIYIWDSLEEFGNEETLNIFYKSLVLLTHKQKTQKQKKFTIEITKMCLQYCFKNFTLVIKNKFFMEPITDYQVMTALHLIIQIGDLIENVEDVYLPLVAHILERKSDYSFDINQYLSENLKTVDYEALKGYMTDYCNGGK